MTLSCSEGKVNAMRKQNTANLDGNSFVHISGGSAVATQGDPPKVAHRREKAELHVELLEAP